MNDRINFALTSEVHREHLRISKFVLANSDFSSLDIQRHN